ncbi:MAG: hypothetical protein KGJ59_12785 [Bacteroidota bacterium]|nr:hypothetical protein [Bacteroidota bacterium]
MKEHALAHFGLYEFVRILAPGFYFILVLFVYIAAFTLPFFPFDEWEIGLPAFFIGAMIAGLTMYAKESPKKRKAFLSNQPSQYILERSRRIKDAPAMSEDEARRLYFYILNHYIPATVRDKIFFFGTIYHVMISIRRTSFWFGVLGIVFVAVKIAASGHIFIEQILPVAVVWLIYVLNVRYNKADRRMQENYQDQIFWLSMNSTIVDELIAKRMHIQTEP